MAADTIEDILAKAQIEPKTGPFVLLREDYSNVVYMVDKNLSEAAANHLKDVFTARGHHQRYWAQEPDFDPDHYVPNDIIPICTP